MPAHAHESFLTEARTMAKLTNERAARPDAVVGTALIVVAAPEAARRSLTRASSLEAESAPE
jgi:hypothetical protein